MIDTGHVFGVVAMWSSGRPPGRRSGRMGEILKVLGAPEHWHFSVRWEDERESVLYPGEGGIGQRKKATPAAAPMEA